MPLDFMGSYVLAIAFDLAPERKKESIAGHLIRKIEENGDCLDTGFLTTPYLLDALCKIGRMDKAYKVLLQTKCPSWLYEVNQGANNLGKLYFLQGGRVSGYDKPEPLCLWMRGRLDVPEDKRH